MQERIVAKMAWPYLSKSSVASFTSLDDSARAFGLWLIVSFSVSILRSLQKYKV